MPFRQFVDGERLTGADVNRFWIQQHHVIKAADETVTSSTGAQNDDHLVLPLLANTEYWLEFMLIYDGVQGGDLKFQFAVPAGTTMDWTHGGLGTSATSTVSQVSRNFRQESDTGTVGCPNASTGSGNAIVPGEGRIKVGSTAGNLQLQWAQNTLNATGTIMRARSLMIIQRLTV